MPFKQSFKLILPAGLVPLERKVTKVRGANEYTLVDVLKVYSKDAEGNTVLQEIKADPGVLFMVDDKGVANAIPASKEVCWVTTRSELRYWLRHGEVAGGYDDE